MSFKLSPEQIREYYLDDNVDMRKFADKASAWTAWEIMGELQELADDFRVKGFIRRSDNTKYIIRILSELLASEGIGRAGGCSNCDESPHHIVDANKKIEGRPDFCPECGMERSKS